MEIIKADGEKQPFDEHKLRFSLVRAGASPDLVNMVIERVLPQLHDGISTGELYRTAFAILKEYEHPVAARYSLKRAVMELGPSGFPFEKFIGELFKTQGYTNVATGKVLRGFCVDHEVDVVAYKGARMAIVEAKFHNSLGVKSDLKVALYVRERINDLVKGGKDIPHGQSVEPWLVTNTSLTENAITYGMCSGLHMLSWEYPQQGNLHDLVSTAGLHPLTCLTTLSRGEKTQLLENGVVLCDTLRKRPELFGLAGISKAKTERVLAESERVCVPQY